jgi:hypothetical protein
MVLGISSTAKFNRRDAETQRKNLDANCTNYHKWNTPAKTPRVESLKQIRIKRKIMIKSFGQNRERSGQHKTKA